MAIGHGKLAAAESFRLGRMLPGLRKAAGRRHAGAQISRRGDAGEAAEGAIEVRLIAIAAVERQGGQRTGWVPLQPAQKPGEAEQLGHRAWRQAERVVKAEAQMLA